MSAIPFQAPQVRFRRLPQRRSAIAHALAALRRWRRRIEERAELARLDERTLRDIGVTRAEVIAVIDKPFWKE